MRGAPVNRRDLLLAALTMPTITMSADAQQEDEPKSEAAAPLANKGPSSDAIRALLADRVDVGRDSVGYVALIGYSTRTEISVAVMSDAAGWTTPGLGRHPLSGGYPVPKVHRQVPIDPAKLSAHAGRYSRRRRS